MASPCATAAIYTFPVNTATLVVSVENYDKVGQPDVPYDLYVNPPTLQFGYAPASHLVYESAIIFDREQFLTIPEETGVINLHLAPVSVSNTAYCYIQDISVDHPIPAPLDLNWWTDQSGVVVLWAFDPGITYLPMFMDLVPQDAGGHRYIGWVMTSAFCGDGVNEMADPFLRVITVPELPSALCLSSMLALLRLSIRRRRSADCKSLLSKVHAALAASVLRLRSRTEATGVVCLL